MRGDKNRVVYYQRLRNVIVCVEIRKSLCTVLVLGGVFSEVRLVIVLSIKRDYIIIIFFSGNCPGFVRAALVVSQ